MIWVGSQLLRRLSASRSPRTRSSRSTTARPAHETIIVNERFVARFFNGEDPLGRRVSPLTEPNATTPDPWLTIVGVMPDGAPGRSARVERHALIYVPSRQRPQRATNIVVRALGDPGRR